jgi:hypothetical protein
VEDPHAANRRLAASRLAKVVWNGYLSVMKTTGDPVGVASALGFITQETWDKLADMIRVHTPVSEETKALVKELILAREGWSEGGGEELGR